MPGDYVVCRSEFIESEREARQYYQQRLAGTRVVVCRGTPLTIVFAFGGNHVYTEGVRAQRLLPRQSSGGGCGLVFMKNGC